MQVPDARTLTRWERWKVIAAVGRHCLETGEEMCWQIPVEYDHVPCFRADGSMYWARCLMHPGNTLYLKSPVYRFWEHASKVKRNWYKGLENWQAWFHQLEWRFRSRIEEE